MEAHLFTEKPNPETPISLVDETVGKNLADIRGEMSQSALARVMREKGITWNQNIVAKVEAGTRPLRVAELVALEEIFEIPGYHITSKRPEVDYLRAELEETLQKLTKSYAAAVDSVANFLTIRYEYASEFLSWIDTEDAPKGREQSINNALHATFLSANLPSLIEDSRERYALEIIQDEHRAGIDGLHATIGPKVDELLKYFEESSRNPRVKIEDIEEEIDESNLMTREDNGVDSEEG